LRAARAFLICGRRWPERAQVAQLVEQRTENPRVGGSIPPLGTNTFKWLASQANPFSMLHVAPFFRAISMGMRAVSAGHGGTMRHEAAKSAAHFCRLLSGGQLSGGSR
jgi:hypothetical protein